MAYMLDVLNEEYDRLISKKDFYMNLMKNLLFMLYIKR